MPRHDAVAEAPLIGGTTTPSRADALAAALGTDLDVAWVATTGSTNSDLLARLAAGADPTRIALRVADAQSAGRGRLGRRWRGAPGRSLTFSVAAPFVRVDLSGLSIAVGVAVADALESIGADRADAPGVGLKWPNDLCLVERGRRADDGPWRKLGGILIETAPARGMRVAVVGVGINLLEPDAADLPYRAAWLGERCPSATAASTLGAVAPALLGALAAFDRDGLSSDVCARFAARDVLGGHAVCAGPADRAPGAVVASAGTVEGVAAGIAANGALRVRRPDGSTVAVSSGEVSVRLARRTGAGAAPC